MYMYMYICICTYIYIYIYMYQTRYPLVQAHVLAGAESFRARLPSTTRQLFFW